MRAAKKLRPLVFSLMALFAFGSSLQANVVDSELELQTLGGEPYLFHPNKQEQSTLMVFWATWCKECRYEIPALIKLYRQKPKDVKIIAISVAEDPKVVQNFVTKAEIPYTNLIDRQGRVAELFDIKQTPTLILLDRHGQIVDRSHRLVELQHHLQSASPPPQKKLAFSKDRPLTTGHGIEAAHIERHSVLMGTNISLLILTEDKVRANQAMDAALTEMARIEQVMTDWNDHSELMRIVKHAGVKPVEVSTELFFILTEGKRLSALTQGAFDISYAAAGALWDFNAAEAKPPSDDLLKKTLPLINYKHVVLDADKRTAFLEKAGMRLGLGGIAKGYAVDRAVAVIHAYGFKNFAVNAGGDLTVRGKKAGKLWWVAIRHPRNKQENIAILPISNGSVVTSGDNERFFIYNGKRYAHILDPKTGMPAEGVQSVTIMAKKAYFADALATGVFVLGAEDGLALIESLPNTEGLIIDSQGKLHVSSGLQNKPIS